MNKEYEKRYHLIENNNWWFVGRRDIILKLIKKLNIKKDSKILDIGCSGGALIKYLKKNGFSDITGIDISKEAIENCKKECLKNVYRMDCTETNFKDECFDVIISSDILEHIKNEKKAVMEWKRILKKGGKLIVFVPAFNILWGNQDIISHHYKRYSKKELVNLFKNENLIIKKVSYWNFIIFFPAFIIRLIKRVDINKQGIKKDELYKLNPLLNKLVINMLKFENNIIKNIYAPVGVSFFIIAEKD